MELIETVCHSKSVHAAIAQGREFRMNVLDYHTDD